MKKIISIICLCLFLPFTNLLSQILPDYKERNFLSVRDSVLKNELNIQASEGLLEPDKYFVGPGDKLFISIKGSQEISFTLSVNHEGVIFIPNVTSIDLKGLTLLKAKEKISSVVNKYYKSVEVFTTLVEFRKIKVSLLGNVKAPFTYVMFSNNRLNDLISNSTGLLNTANLRNIKIVSNDGNVKYCDLLSFLRYGAKENNPYLSEGDLVLIDKIDKTIAITGLVKYPGVYEFIEGESVQDLINLAGGFLFKARLDSIEIISFSANGTSQISKYQSADFLKNNEVILNNGDMIIVREQTDFMIEQIVYLEGFVKYPGTYKIIKDKTTLKDIIEIAGGFRDEASLIDAVLNRQSGGIENDPEFERLKLIPRADMTEDEYDYLKAKSRQRKGKVVVDFEQLFIHNKSAENVILKKGDIINVPEKKNYIILLGQVVNPGNIIYKKEYSYIDYINLAGGFGWRAQEGEVRIIKANTGEWIYADEDDLLDPGDTIWIPEDPPGPKFWDVFTTSLTIIGQVAAVIAATVAVIVATR